MGNTGDVKINKRFNVIKQYKWGIFFALIILGLYIYNRQLGIKAVGITAANIKTMFTLLPPILILVGLLDVWVPKETLVKYMGTESGVIGVIIALVLGSAAAGPLYAAFPIAALLLKKGARLAYVIFFLGVWSSTKLPIVLFEVASLGLKFTLVHIGVSLPLYLATAYFIEKITPEESLALMREKAQSL